MLLELGCGGNTTSEVAKITISLAPELLRATDEVARQDNKPRSGIIREALAMYLEERECQEMIRSYQEMAELNRELAEQSLAPVNEVWARYD